MDSNQNLPKKQRRIGLTGGIATGKSTIAKYIKDFKNIEILDADIFSKELLVRGTKSYEKIIEHFSDEITEKDKSSKEINTKKLKTIIFNNQSERLWLEELLHPLIREKMIHKCYELKNKKILLLVIPLLFEAKFNDLCTEIWLVKCSKKRQIKRLMIRDSINEKEALKIINIQSSVHDKEKRSQLVIINEKEENSWKNQIDQFI